jgi:single-stranded DNA-specific DHH superfamily exonuclease
MGIRELGRKLGKDIKVAKSFVGTYADVVGLLKQLDDFDKIIIVDIAVAHGVDVGKDMLIIDHHILKKDPNSEKVIFINPRFKHEEIYQPASYLTYKLMSRLVDMKDVGWVSAIGIVSDWGYEDCRDVLDRWVKVEKKDDLFGTDIGQAGDLLLGASYIVGFDRILELLTTANSLEEVTESPDIISAYDKYNAAFEDGKAQFWKNAETVGNVVFGKVKPKLKRLGSPVINRISFENPDKAVFLFEDIGDGYKVSARYQDAEKAGVHLGRIMERCCDGGGHRAAAGGSATDETMGGFKKRILKELGVK